MLTVGSLFAGIGGIELGLERTGYFKTIWQVENDEYATKILEKNWPEVRRYGDIRTIGKGCYEVADSKEDRWDSSTQQEMDEEKDRRETGCGLDNCCENELPYVDLICGGFPCQDISNAGKRAGIEGKRSGLWKEFLRIIRMVRPKYVLVENVAALANRGLDVVLGDLSESGYDAEWNIVSAASVGAPHRRKRLFVFAHTHSHSSTEKHGKICGTPQEIWGKGEGGQSDRCGDALADTECGTMETQRDGEILEEQNKEETPRGLAHDSNKKADAHNTDKRRYNTQKGKIFTRRNCTVDSSWWAVEPDVGRVAHGVPNRVDRLKCLGNAVVPQVAEAIGMMIMNYDKVD